VWPRDGEILEAVLAEPSLKEMDQAALCGGPRNPGYHLGLLALRLGKMLTIGVDAGRKESCVIAEAFASFRVGHPVSEVGGFVARQAL
jgi:hypothetical protein